MWEMYFTLVVFFAWISISSSQDLTVFKVMGDECSYGNLITYEITSLRDGDSLVADGNFKCGDTDISRGMLHLGAEHHQICQGIINREFGTFYQTVVANKEPYKTLDHGFLLATADFHVNPGADMRHKVYPECYMVLYRRVSSEKKTWLKCDGAYCFIEGISSIHPLEGGEIVGYDQAFTKDACLKVCKDSHRRGGYGNYGRDPARDCIIIDHPECGHLQTVKFPYLGDAIRRGDVSISLDGAVAYLNKTQTGPVAITDADLYFEKKNDTWLILEKERQTGYRLDRIERDLKGLVENGLKEIKKRDEEGTPFIIGMTALALSVTCTAFLVAAVVANVCNKRGADPDSGF